MDRFFFFLFFRSVRLRARARAERRGNKETTLAKRTDFKTDDFTKRERERKEERREKEHARDERERSNRPITVAAPFSSSLVACYSLLSLTDKPAGSGDANLQLLLRPVRLGAVDPSQGVLLARGVRSFRISHILSSYACDCLVVEDVFVRTRRFGRERTRRRKKVRREQQAKEGERERGRERGGAFFHLFCWFCFFFEDDAFVVLPLFSLFFVCFYLERFLSFCSKSHLFGASLLFLAAAQSANHRRRLNLSSLYIK